MMNGLYFGEKINLWVKSGRRVGLPLINLVDILRLTYTPLGSMSVGSMNTHRADHPSLRGVASVASRNEIDGAWSGAQSDMSHRTVNRQTVHPMPRT